jgi:hypothetical protein
MAGGKGGMGIAGYRRALPLKFAGAGRGTIGGGLMDGLPGPGAWKGGNIGP